MPDSKESTRSECRNPKTSGFEARRVRWDVDGAQNPAASSNRFCSLKVDITTTQRVPHSLSMVAPLRQQYGIVDPESEAIDRADGGIESLPHTPITWDYESGSRETIGSSDDDF